MRIFHIATLADWRQAEQTGSYTTSTYGVSLADEGFLHASHRRQVRGVLDRYYGEVSEPLLVLEIDTDLLHSPWREELVGEETYPHIFGPLNTDAVVGWRPARLPPIEPLTTSARRPPASPLVNAFYGLTLILGVAAVVLAGAGLVADAQVHAAVPSLPRSTEFLVWTLAAAVGAAAAAAYAVGWLLRRQDEAHRGEHAETEAP